MLLVIAQALGEFQGYLVESLGKPISVNTVAQFAKMAYAILGALARHSDD